MKLKLIAPIGLVIAVLGVFLFVINSESNTPKVNETQNIKELVSDYSNGKIKNHTASITSHQLNVTDRDGKELTYDLPEDEFFVSIAPYIDETHP